LAEPFFQREMDMTNLEKTSARHPSPSIRIIAPLIEVTDLPLDALNRDIFLIEGSAVGMKIIPPPPASHASRSTKRLLLTSTVSPAVVRNSTPA